jgi:NAD(P)-dependent dehydrogenase (short-subunit alcohol dehydrogenase family)
MSAVITGASYPGIGFFSAKYLAALGFRAVLLCRDLDKGEEARRKIVEEDPLASVRVVIGDLNDLESLKKKIVPEIKEECEGTWLALLVNNAGIALGSNSKMVPLNKNKNNNNNKLEETEMVDETLLTNYLGPYCLTELLVPTIKSEKIKKIELNVPKKKLKLFLKTKRK